MNLIKLFKIKYIMNLKIICLLIALSAINADKILEIAPFGD